MIKNERQYRVTKAQLRTFQESLKGVGSMDVPSDVEPEMLAAARSAFAAQLEELQSDVEEYEALQRGEVTRFVADNLSHLPLILIKARIALKLTQRDLASRLDAKEQQVQRWEATDYENASIETLKQVIEALGVETRGELFVPNAQLTAKVFLRKLVSAGIPKDFLLHRLLPSNVATLFDERNVVQAGLREILDAASAVARVFGVHIGDLVSDQPLRLAFAGVAETRFKLLARSKIATLDAYTVYAHYLAALVETCAEPASSRSVPRDWRVVHKALSQPGSPITLLKTLQYLWDHNVVVLPLRDEGAFHGAIWKIRGRFVIIVKQKTALEARWLFDLLHEVGHAALGHVTDETALIEDQPISQDARGSEEEEANEWAEDTLFNGDSSLLEDACVQACGGRLQRLNRVISNVADRANVNVGALANHMAFRLASEGKDWWGAANNLQAKDYSPFGTVRDALLERIAMRKLNPFDRDLLMRALTEE